MIIRISNANLPGVGKKKKDLPPSGICTADKGWGGSQGTQRYIYKTCVIREDVVNQLNEHPKG